MPRSCHHAIGRPPNQQQLLTIRSRHDTLRYCFDSETTPLAECVMRDTENKSKEQAPGKGASKPALVRPPRAELVWEGKYNANGKRVAPLRVALPFQTVETVNESAQERQRGFQFGSALREEAWRNRLIWGDKKYVLPSLLPEFAGKVNLVYIDPPFDTGADFSFTATVPDHPDDGDDDFVHVHQRTKHHRT